MSSKTCLIKEKDYLTRNEACEWLSVSKDTLYKWERLGLKVLKVGKLKRYSKKYLSEFLEAFVE